MSVLALIGGVFFILVGISGKGRAFKSKMGTPLGEKEIKLVRITYIAVGILLLFVAAVSIMQLTE